MSLPLLAAGCLIIAAAGFTQGLTSFGFALLSMPLLSGFLPMNVVVPVIVILSLFSNIAILWESVRYVRLRSIWILILSSLVSAPFGVYLLRIMDSGIMKVSTGVMIILFAILLLKGISFPVRRERLAFVPVGLTSGLLNGSIAISGPPVALFLSSQGEDKRGFRANITAYALILNVMTVASYGYGGMLRGEVIRYVVWFTPVMFLGVLGGVRMARCVSEAKFKRITLMLLLVSGGWTALTGLGIL